MSFPPWFLAGYWNVRHESIERCSERLREFLLGLSECDIAFATWYETATSRKQSFQKRVVVENRAYLVDLLERGRNWDDENKLLEDLGFSISLWNGRSNENAANILIHCGCYSRWSGNSVVLYLPQDLGKLREPERMTALLALVARTWEPDSGGVMSVAVRAAKEAIGKEVIVPFVDWMLYLSNQRAPEMPSLPPPASVEKVEGHGHIIVVHGEPSDVTNPEHLRNIERVEIALKAKS